MKKLFVVRFSKMHNKVFCLPFVLWRRTTKFYVCRAFYGGAWQIFMFAVRFVQAHGKVSKNI
jgi:hypothetical protein